jgi:co-chaperonin GroES (HSP10)
LNPHQPRAIMGDHNGDDMTIRGISDHVIVERESAHDVFEIVGHKEHRGTVVAVGPGKLRQDPTTGKEWFCPMTVKAGDRILFSHRAGMEQTIEGRKLLVMHETDILCILDDDATVALGADWRQEECQVVGTYNVHNNGKAVRV